MSTSTEQPASDPDLLTLVPRRSPGRTAALVAGGIALVALAAYSPQLRPTLVSDSGYGGMQEPLASGDVMSGLLLEPRRGVTTGIGDIADVEGAHLVGAWIAQSPVPDHGSTTPAPDAATFLRRSYPDRTTIPADLPASAFAPAAPGSETWLVLQWRPDGCIRVQDDAAPAATGPVATVRGLLGIPVDQTLPDVAGPVLIGPPDTPSAVPLCEQPTP